MYQKWRLMKILAWTRLDKRGSPKNTTTSEDDDDLDEDQNYVPDSLAESEETDDNDEKVSSDNSSVGETETLIPENNDTPSWSSIDVSEVQSIKHLLPYLYINT